MGIHTSSSTGTKDECRSRRARVSNPRANQLRSIRPLAQLRCIERLVESIRRQDILSITVPIDVKLDTGTSSQLAHETIETLDLGGVAGLLALVGLGAWVGGGAAGVGAPCEGPVAVDVAADAGWVYAGGGALSVFAPETVDVLGVDESWGEVSMMISGISYHVEN